MKVIYWKAQCNFDHDCYSIRAKTKKECKRLIEENEEWGVSPGDYDEPEKIVIEYKNAFDLVEILRSEGSSSY